MRIQHARKLFRDRSDRNPRRRMRDCHTNQRTHTDHAGLISAARTYWTDISLRTTASLREAYEYLDSAEQTECPEPTFESATKRDKPIRRRPSI